MPALSTGERSNVHPQPGWAATACFGTKNEAK